MIKLLSITIFLTLSLQSFAQWKSFYPSREKKEESVKKEEKTEANKQKFDKNYFEGIKAKSLENNEKAIKSFSKCLELNSESAPALYELSLLYQKQGDFNLALEKINKAIALDSENKWFILTAAEINFSTQDFKTASTQYKRLIELEPKKEELYFQLADVYIYDEDYKSAITVYDDLEKINGPNKLLYIQKHKLYMQLKREDKAIKELERALRKYKEDLELMQLLAEAFLLNDQKKEAFIVFNKMSKISPDNGRLHLSLSEYYRDIGENEKSFEELHLAFKSKTLSIDVKVGILVSYFALINYEEKMKEQALKLGRTLVLVHKSDPKAHAVYADLLYSCNMFTDAEIHYEEVLSMEKSKVEVWTQLLFIQIEKKDFDKMLELSSQAITYFPFNALLYYFNGIANYRLSNPEETVKSLNSGLEFIVDNDVLLLEFYSSLADAYNTLDNYELSDSFYEKALELDSHNVIVLNNYAYYLSLRKAKLLKAKRMSFKCNSLEPNNGTYQDTYAWILYQNLEYSEAKKWILKALENGGEKNAVIVEHYGDILYKLGETKEAIKNWEKAKELGEGSIYLERKIQKKELYE